MSETTSDKVLGVLDLFLGERGDWTVEDAAATLGLSVTTTYRYFKSLVRSGLINAFVPGRYVLGPAVVQLDRQMRLHDPLLSVARPVMDRLAAEVGKQAAVILARLYHDGVMCVHEARGGAAGFAISYERGRLMPITRGASSKVILANLSPRMLRSLQEPKGDNAPAKVELSAAQREELRAIRSRGVAITEAELDVGMRGVAVPIFQPDRTVDGSLSLVVPQSRGATDKLIEQLIHARSEIEAGLAIRASQAG